jgi:hypothetical protein
MQLVPLKEVNCSRIQRVGRVAPKWASCQKLGTTNQNVSDQLFLIYFFFSPCKLDEHPKRFMLRKLARKLRLKVFNCLKREAENNFVMESNCKNALTFMSGSCWDIEVENGRLSISDLETLPPSRHDALPYTSRNSGTLVSLYNYHRSGHIHRPIFYLKLNSRFVRTSQETHYVSATSPTG